MKFKAIILFALIPNFYLHAQEKHRSKAPDFAIIEARVKKEISEKKLPSMVIAVAQNGEIIYEQAFGYADVGNKIEATIHTPYQLASATKPFTAAAIMMLYQKGLLNIDSPITKYIAGLTLNKADPHFSTPTIKQVLNHTSGLGTYFDIGYADENYSFDDFANGWKRYGTIFLQPGTVCEYSNLGYGLLGQVIANVTGKKYEDFMAAELFNPLKLNDTYVAAAGDVSNLSARKYDADGTELQEVINNTPGAGNVYASADDLLHFGMFHLGNGSKRSTVLNDSLLQLMHNYKNGNTLYTINKNTFYGLGWYNQVQGDGTSVLWHEGGMPGASSMLKLFPKENIVIAVITNTYNYPFCREITDAISKIVIPTHEPMPIDEMANFKNYTSDSTFMGNWDGNIVVEGKQIPASLSIDRNEIILTYLDLTMKSFLTEGQPIPHKTVLLYGMVNQNYFLGTTSGVIPATHLRKEFSHLLILKLIKTNDLLKGTINVMAAANREYYSYPFFVNLKKRQ